MNCLASLDWLLLFFAHCSVELLYWGATGFLSDSGLPRFSQSHGENTLSISMGYLMRMCQRKDTPQNIFCVHYKIFHSV